MEPQSDDVNHEKGARIRELKENATQVQVNDTTKMVRGFART